MEKRNYIVAMDPGSSNVTIAVGSQDDDGRLALAGIISKPILGMTRGEITNRQQVSVSIREAVNEAEQKFNIRISDVYTGVSGKHIKCTTHEYFVFVGERSDGEIRREDVDMLHDGMNNVQAEDGIRIMERIPQCYVVDGRDTVKDPVGRFGKKLESSFNFVLGSTTLIDRLEKTLLALGVRSRKTYPAALAAAEAVTLPEEKEMGVAVIDIGAGTTDLCVYHDNAVRFVRGIPFGASDINHDIHQQGILERHVEGLKTKFGAAMANRITVDKLITITGRSPREKQEISQKNLAIIIENRLREIIGFVMDEIGDSGYAGKLRGGIVLTGGASQMAGIDELFREVTGMEVRLALPDVRVTDESVAMAQDPSCAAAIGLLLKAISEGKTVRAEPMPQGEPPRRPEQPAGQPTRSEQPARPENGYGRHDGSVTPPQAAAHGQETAPDDTDDDISTDHKIGFLRRIRRKIEDTLFPETLDGDEDL